jgi:hypothetical protein
MQLKSVRQLLARKCLIEDKEQTIERQKERWRGKEREGEGKREREKERGRGGYKVNFFLSYNRK